MVKKRIHKDKNRSTLINLDVNKNRVAFVIKICIYYLSLRRFVEQQIVVPGKINEDKREKSQ